ncbi:MAG: hypothetical protein RL885_16665 [Planctomycetota bacterium]
MRSLSRRLMVLSSLLALIVFLPAMQTNRRAGKHMNDHFGGSTLSSQWSVLHPELVNIDVSGGWLNLTALASGPSASWYADGEGPLVYKWVTGNFTVITRVRAYDPQNPSQPPPPEYRLGGLSVRNPVDTPGQHSWAHVAVGGGDAAVPVAVEDKTTLASNSDLILYPVPATDVEMRIQRRGARISLSYRSPGVSDWTLLREHQHPELPPTVQVGLHVNSWDSPARAAASFDYIIFGK